MLVLLQKLTLKIITVGKLIYRISFAIVSRMLSVSGGVRAVIKLYQYFISPNLGKHCRFYPSCSEYSFLAIEKYGLIKGAWRGIRRILKCHPWNLGGIDPP